MDENNNTNYRATILVSAVTFLAICFCASYFVTDYINGREQEKAQEIEEDKTVSVQSNNYLKDSVIITLKTGDLVDSEQTLATVKQINKVTKDLTKSELNEIMSKSGYKLVEMTESKILFQRPKDYKISSGVEPNKYYIGEKDGYFAVYASNEKGELSITSQEDIFRDDRKVDDLPEIDQKKVRGFKLMYDTREDAIEGVTEFTS